MTDTIVSEGKKEEILHLLEEVYRERFGIPVEIRVEYKEKEESKTREYDEQRVQREIDAIFARNKKAHGEESPQPEESQAGEEQKQGSSETKQKEKSLTLGGKSKESGNGKKGFKKEFKRDFVRPLKQGDDPSLISETKQKEKSLTLGGKSKESGNGKKGFKKEFKRDFVRPLKQGDDPSLIYGRNFEDEPIRLDQVVTEMGEITIHGKIISFETREIRNEKTIVMFAVYGRNFEDEPIRLDQVVTEMGEITIHGKIISFETREIRNEKTIVMFAVSDFTDTIMVKMFTRNDQLAELLGDLKKIISFETREIRNEKTIVMFAVSDFTDTIMVKMFTRNDQLAELLGDLKKGAYVKIKGVTTIDKYDGELTIGSVTGIKKIGDFTEKREDLSPLKRVELHCDHRFCDRN